MAKRIRKLVLTLILTTSCALSNASVVDQSTLFPQIDNLGVAASYGLESGFRVGQSFQPGFTGYLDRVELQVMLMNPISVQNNVQVPFSIYATSPDGLPVGDALATSFLAPPENYDPGFFGH